MVEEPISLHRAACEEARADMSPAAVPQVTFDRPELNRILTVYGRMVAAGEWRDYALDFLDEVAVFSIFRHASRDAAVPHRKTAQAARPPGPVQRGRGRRDDPQARP